MADEAVKAEVKVEDNEDDEDDDAESAGYARHAMFPRDDDGPETRDIVWIQLLRMLPDGTVQTCPDQFRASELPHWGEVYRRFGGGKYRAKGRNAKMQWQAESPGGSDWHVFDGASKPFAVNPVETVVAAAPPPPPAAPPPPPPSPSASSGPTWAEAIAALKDVASSVMTAIMNRPHPPTPPPPDNSLAIAMMNNMAAQSQANAKAQTDVLVALLSRDTKPDNSSLVAVLNANAETTRAQAAAQNTLLTAVLTQKPPGLADLADALTKLGRSGTQPGGIKDTIETIKAVREISGPTPAPGGGELGEVTSLVSSLAALDKSSGSKEKEESASPARRRRILVRTAMGMVEVVDPSPEFLRQLAAPVPALGPATAVAAPAAQAPAPSAVVAAPAVSPPAPEVPARAVVEAPMPVVVAAPPTPGAVAPAPAPAAEAVTQTTAESALSVQVSEEEELVQLAAKLRSDPSRSLRLAQLLRDVPAGAAESVAPPPEPPAPAPPPAAPSESVPAPGPTPAPSTPESPQGAGPEAAEKTIVVGGIEVTVLEPREAPGQPIQLPASFEAPGAGAVPPADAAPRISDETIAKLTRMKADDIEALVRRKIGPKADGIADAIRALPPEALPFALKMFPPDALRALAAG